MVSSPLFWSFPLFVPILTLNPIFLNFSPTSPVISIILLRKYITPSAPPDPRPSDRLTRSSPPVTRYRWPRSHPPSLWDAVLGFNLPALSASHHHRPPLGLCLPRLWSTIATISTLYLTLLPFSAILHHFTAFPPFWAFLPRSSSLLLYLPVCFIILEFFLDQIKFTGLVLRQAAGPFRIRYPAGSPSLLPGSYTIHHFPAPLMGLLQRHSSSLLLR